jgi:selenocysteine-specific elongation factor
MRHVIIGTAGHIDHGKSTLVLALTGTDPDRLQEEKARGITIDLGFAHTVENGIALSFVDVPGHERFVRNMMAGVGGMDLVMLHVAADESVMPQTREHFEICRLLRVPAGLVVLTKADLVDDATLDVVRLEVQELVAGSFLDTAPVVTVSARTGAGLTDLRRTLAHLGAAAPIRPSSGPPRLPIDRVFSMRGFGTVVTGSLAAGRLGVDDELVLLPAGRHVKVRGLQVHGTKETEAVAGQRVAVNLTGVDAGEIVRGETLTVPEAVTITRRVDVGIELLASAPPLRHGARVRFHNGTRELLGRVIVSGGPEIRSAETAFARIRLESPAVLTRGDRFILRAYSPLVTIGGGTVLDPDPTKKGVRTPAGQMRFASIAELSDPFDAVAVMIEESGLAGFPLSGLAGRAGVRHESQDALIVRLEESGRAVRFGDHLVSSSHVAEVRRGVLGTVGEYHAHHPLEEGIPREQLRESLFADAPAALFERVLTGLQNDGAIVVRDRVALKTHRLLLSDEDARVRDAILHVALESGLTPPDRLSVATRVAAPTHVVERITALLVRQKLLVRLGDLLFHEATLNRLKTEIQSLKREGARTAIDVAAFKERYGVSRKYAIPLLEFLDGERITRRVGDTRQIL